MMRVNHATMNERGLVGALSERPRARRKRVRQEIATRSKSFRAPARYVHRKDTLCNLTPFLLTGIGKTIIIMKKKNGYSGSHPKSSGSEIGAKGLPARLQSTEVVDRLTSTVEVRTDQVQPSWTVPSFFQTTLAGCAAI